MMQTCCVCGSSNYDGFEELPTYSYSEYLLLGVVDCVDPELSTLQKEPQSDVNRHVEQKALLRGLKDTALRNPI